MRFVATTTNVTIGTGAYLRNVPEEMALRPRPSLLPEDERPVVSVFAAQPPPFMPAGATVLLGSQPAPVLWAEGAEALVEIGGKVWLLSHMTPAEMTLYRNAYEPGSRVQEWIIRRQVEDLAEFGR